MKKKVYISSTFKDLIEYRSMVRSLFENELSKYFRLSKIMELMWDDGSQTPFLTECIEEVKNSDILIIILGNKVGSYPPNQTRTYTEIEIDTAISNGKKIYFFRLTQFDENLIDNKIKHEEIVKKFAGKSTHSFKDKIDLSNELLKCLLPLLQTNGNTSKELTTRKDISSYIEELYLAKKLNYEQIFPNKINLYNEIFNHFIVLSGEIKKITPDKYNIFDSILNYIIKINKEGYLFVEGNPGTGKSTFLSVLYYYFLDAYKNRDFPFFPLYIDLEIYNDFLDDSEALKKFKLDINPLKEWFNNNEHAVVLIFDNFDDHFKNRIQLNTAIIQEFNKRANNKVIVGLSITDRLPREKNENNVNTVSKIILQDIKNSDDLPIILKSFIKLYTVHDNEQSYIDLAELLIKRFKLENIDFFLLQLIYNNKDQDTEIKRISHFAQFIEKISQKYIPPSDKYFTLISSKVFDFYIYSKKDNGYISNNYKAWHYANSNLSLRNYFLAKHIINSLVTFGKSKDEKLIPLFSHVYPSEINKFCKEIMISSYNAQKVVYNGIESGFDKVKITGQIHFCYLLGRLEHTHFKERAKSILKKALKNLKSKIGKKQKLSNQEKLFERTLYISLAYLGDKQSSDEYVNLILINKDYDKVNRGFHLEYYGDLNYDIEDENSLSSYDDNNYPIYNTFNMLIFRLKSAIKSNQPHQLFNIELQTICSLLQHRRRKYYREYQSQYQEISSLIQEVLNRPAFCYNKQITNYITSLKKYFDNSEFSELDYFRKISNIKDVPRSGWNREDKSRYIPNPENVAAHHYGCILIAKFFLPDTLEATEYPESEFLEYNKSNIIEILLYHDLGEYLHGDVSSDLKGESNYLDEKQAMEEISFLTTFESYGNLLDIYENWEKFENRANSNVNFKIAKDIDKLENLNQLLKYYYENQYKTLDFSNFFNSLHKEIETEVGMSIFYKIIDPYRKYLENEAGILYTSLKSEQ